MRLQLNLLVPRHRLGTRPGYPEKAVIMVAPFPAGRSVDLVARAVARKMSEIWKQPVIVSNRLGASGNIGTSKS